jgi:ubiquitin-conjugating enzyme E2 Q
MLDIEAALSLNEIVNVPDEFVHSQTHLVVAQLDWIQTRYLFVKCGPGVKVKHSGMEADVEPEQRLLQGGICPVGPDGKPLIIPVTAVTKSRRPGAIAVSTKAVPRGEGKSKKSKVEAGEGEVKDFSEYYDEEDLEVLLPVEKRGLPASVTPYTPGTLDGSDWPHLPPPSYATQQASKALQRLLKATLKVQENSRLHELGWFLDDVMLTNLYQWIFEIHSFEKTLPLAQDMQSKGLQSIIFEVRFGKDFPFSPPFVRVIRPRFRPFQQGGGGHVTAGGAMCMELLTNSGWNPASTMEAVMLQVRMALTNLEPFPARLEGGPVRSYCAEEAIEAYKRACRAHGWQVPDDFRFFSDNSTHSDGPGFLL